MRHGPSECDAVLPTVRPQYTGGREVSSKVVALELLAREAKLGEPILEVIGEKRHRQEIRGGATIVCPRGLAAQFPPALRPGIASPQPRQGNEVNLLIFAHGADEAL